jgi:hypothetical protein
MSSKRRMKSKRNGVKRHRQGKSISNHKRPGDSNPAMPDRDVPSRLGNALSYQQQRRAAPHAQVAIDKALAS